MSGAAGWNREWLAPAKLNLFLHVVGRRADGYHLLQTVFRLIDRCDRLRFEPRSDGEVCLMHPLPGVPEDTELSVRAARALKSETGCKLGVSIGLRKSIPMGGGLGGGSSDAATALMALNSLWELDLPPDRLALLASRLGADVPFFLHGTSAFGEGVGDRLVSVDLAPAWYVVLTPPVRIPTAEVFADPGLTRDSKIVTISSFSAGPRSPKLHNDLEPVVCRRYPVVAAHLAWLRDFGDARLSGSGACVFAEFPTEVQARSVLDRVPGGMSGFVAAGLDRHPVRTTDSR